MIITFTDLNTDTLYIFVEKPKIKSYNYYEWSNAMFEEYPDILTVPMVGNALGIGTRSVYTLIREKKLGHIRIGRKIIIPKICLQEFIDSVKIENLDDSGCLSTGTDRKE